jgi:hypothetical protein
MGFGMAALVSEDARYAIPAGGGAAVGIGGMVLLATGDAVARGSLDPR